MICQWRIHPICLILPSFSSTTYAVSSTPLIHYAFTQDADAKKQEKRDFIWCSLNAVCHEYSPFFTQPTWAERLMHTNSSLIHSWLDFLNTIACCLLSLEWCSTMLDQSRGWFEKTWHHYTLKQTGSKTE